MRRSAPSSMLGAESRSMGPGLGADAAKVARAFHDRVVPCGTEPINRLESAVEAKLSRTRALETTPAEEFPAAFARVVSGVVSTRPHRSSLVAETPPEGVRRMLREARESRLGPADLPALAERLRGAPAEVRLDLASELLHAGAPDRVALLARWVWNPARRTGVLAEFGGPPPESYPGTQARLAEIRLELEALGFPSSTFAAVEVLSALTYPGRLGNVADSSLQGGDIERLLPGPFPLATLLLGVRRRLDDADR